MKRPVSSAWSEKVKLIYLVPNERINIARWKLDQKRSVTIRSGKFVQRYRDQKIHFGWYGDGFVWRARLEFFAHIMYAFIRRRAAN